MTLTIPDSKPYVEFFVRLGSIISIFENKPVYRSLEEKVLVLNDEKDPYIRQVRIWKVILGDCFGCKVRSACVP